MSQVYVACGKTLHDNDTVVLRDRLLGVAESDLNYAVFPT